MKNGRNLNILKEFRDSIPVRPRFAAEWLDSQIGPTIWLSTLKSERTPGVDAGFQGKTDDIPAGLKKSAS